MAQYERCYPKTLNFEGGFQCNSKDRGNWTGGHVNDGILRGTKWGISAHSYPQLDIKSLSKEQAIEIYRRDYWNALHLSLVETDRIAWKIFDIAVNCGRTNAAKWIQVIVGVVVDGIIGRHTLEAINKAITVNEDKLMDEIVDRQKEHYFSIVDENNSEFLAGWIDRADDRGEEFERNLA